MGGCCINAAVREDILQGSTSVTPDLWILATGFWDDGGIWEDIDTWND